MFLLIKRVKSKGWVSVFSEGQFGIRNMNPLPCGCPVTITGQVHKVTTAGMPIVWLEAGVLEGSAWTQC